jgi:two-component system response regulator RegA
MTQELFLLIDDDVAFCAALQRALIRRGHHAETAHNMTDALAALQGKKFTRAVVDLKLASESGLILIAELKWHHPELEVVMLTGYASISTAVEAIKLGALNYLCKPVDADEVLAAFTAGGRCTEVGVPQNPISINRLEWEHIQKVLHENQGNISATARLLGMHRRTLQRKLQKRPAKDTP